MAANQVVLYFDKQEDALLFTLAASSVMSADGPVHTSDAVAKVAEEIRKASRITAQGILNVPSPAPLGVSRIRGGNHASYNQRPS
jgi:hypothetical protein